MGTDKKRQHHFFNQSFLYFWFLIILSVTSIANADSAKLAIIIDDIGYNKKNGLVVAKLPYKVTLAVLPLTPHGTELAEIAHANGKEIMLHTPMSNERNIPLGPGGLTNSISESLLNDILNKNLKNIPHVKGINNHMGSQLTQNEKIMGWLMHYLKLNQLYFIDSRTTAKTQALNQAQAYQLPSRKRDVFLDDRREITHIRKQLMTAIGIAKSKGSAIAIGHPYPETLQILEEAGNISLSEQVELVLVSEILPQSLIQKPAYCPAETEYPSEINPLLMKFDIFDEKPVTK